MKRHIKKLLYPLLIAFISICINFNIEARVTKEVAESTLPYLMEAVGIPQATQILAQRNALISMIYTGRPTRNG